MRGDPVLGEDMKRGYLVSSRDEDSVTRMAVNLDEAGNCLMKSMEIEFHGFSGTGSCLSRP
jgi:hypothetical protein